MPTYKITAPSGKTISVTGDTPPSESDLDGIFKAAGVDVKPDSAAIYGMLTSNDADQRKTGMTLANKMSPAEAQAFFDYQKAATKGKGELTRVDNSVGGVPPEIAALSIGSIGRALAAPAANAGARAVAGAKAVGAQAAPYVKGEVVHGALRLVGAPEWAARGAGYIASAIGGRGAAAEPAGPVSVEGYPRAGVTVAPEPVPVVAEPHMDLSARIPASQLTAAQLNERMAAVKANGGLEATAAPQAVPGPKAVHPGPPPDVAPAVQSARAPAAVSKLSPQQALNELAIAARRAKTTLSGADYDVLKGQVAAGASPADAVAELVKSRIVSDPAAEFARRFGLPSDAERVFPTNKAGLPTGRTSKAP